MKRYIAVLSLVLAFAVLLTACGGNGGGNNAGGGFVPDENVRAAGEFPVCINPVTLTIGIRQEPNTEDFATNALTKWYTEKTNINLEFDIFPTGAPGFQKLQVMMAAGTDLPDVLVGFGNEGGADALKDLDIYNFASAGLIIPLNDYVDKYGYYIKEAFKQRPEMEKYLKMADGNIYSVPGYVEQTSNQWAQRVTVNTKWLEKLGLSMPKTTDDFYEVLKAFKTGDPNGNGKADEIPFAGSPNGWNTQVYDFVMNAFIYNNARDRYFIENGKLFFAYERDEWRDGLRYLNKLYSEGLIAPQSFTQDAAQFRAMIQNPEIEIIGAIAAGGILFAPEDPRKLNYDALPPLTGPKGVSWATKFMTPVNKNYIITKECKYPAAAFRLGDLMMSEEATLWGRWGIPDTDWLKPEPGDVSMYEGLGYKPMLKPLLSWAAVQNSHWHEMGAAFRTNEMSNGQVWNNNPLENEYILARYVLSYMDKAPADAVGRLVYSYEETEEIKEIQSTINSYVAESIARFISGDMNIETGWDAYINELNKIGIDKYRANAQKAYDRMK